MRLLPGNHRWTRPAAAAIAIAIATLSFWINIAHVVPQQTFPTYRDGSEALVLGKIIADREGIDTKGANLGYVLKGPEESPHDVLTSYYFLDGLDRVVPADINDANWVHGVSRHWAGLVVHRAGVSQLGYAPHHFPRGSEIVIPGEDGPRPIRDVITAGPYINIHLGGPLLRAAAGGSPGPVRLVEKPQDTVTPLDLADANWNRGVARFWAGFVVQLASADRDGYAADQFPAGSALRLYDGQRRQVARVEPVGPYLNVYLTGAPLQVPEGGAALKMRLPDRPAALPVEFTDYRQNYGLSGLLHSSAWRHLGLGSLRSLHLATALALAIVVCALCAGYAQALGTGFGLVLFASLVASPWLVAVARNLYWMPFLWFLPALPALALYLRPAGGAHPILLIAVGLAVFVKCLAGYEYTSSVVLFACAIFLIDGFLPAPRLSRRAALTHVARIFAASVAGFAGAILMHASIKEAAHGSFAFKLLSIWLNEVRNRTFGNPAADLDPFILASMTASPFEVLGTYVFRWGTSSIVPGLPGTLFPLLVLSAVAMIIIKRQRRDPTHRRDAAMLVVFGAAGISWLVLAKAHSYVHTHLNFVVWYFGFVAALLYVNLSGVAMLAGWRRAAPSAA